MSSIVVQSNYPDVLRDHNKRLRALEGQVGRWVYVLPVAPAADPPGFNPDDPLSPDFQNGWGNRAFAQPVSFRLHPATKVQMRGALEGGPIPSIAFTLPENYRPTQGPAPVNFPSTDGSLVYTGRVDTNGDVWILDALVTPVLAPITQNCVSQDNGFFTVAAHENYQIFPDADPGAIFSGPPMMNGLGDGEVIDAGVYSVSATLYYGAGTPVAGGAPVTVECLLDAANVDFTPSANIHPETYGNDQNSASGTLYVPAGGQILIFINNRDPTNAIDVAVDYAIQRVA